MTAKRRTIEHEMGHTQSLIDWNKYPNLMETGGTGEDLMDSQVQGAYNRDPVRPDF